MMRILMFFPDGLPTFRPDVAALFGKFLPRRGIMTDAVTIPTNDRPPDSWQGGKAWVASPSGGRAKRALVALGNYYARLFAAKRQDYELIQVRDMAIFGAVACFYARWRKIPFVYWMSFPMAQSSLHVAQQHGRRLGLLRYLALQVKGHLGVLSLYRFVLPRAAHIFVQSDMMRDEVLKAASVPAERVTAVPMAIDPEEFSVGSTGAEPGGPPTAVYLGTCERARRIDFLLEAFRLVADELPAARLVLIGDAIEEADRVWLREGVSARGLESSVTITGWLPREQAIAHLAQADVALALMPPSPLLVSATPTKLVEYLASGKAVVANEHPDQRRILTESGAGLCVPFEAKAYGGALLQLLSDENLRSEMASRARSYVLKHRNYEMIADQVAAVYVRMIALAG